MQFRDLKTQYQMNKNTIDDSIQKVLNENHFINGEEVKLLEKELAEYVGVKNCITCANGTDALEIALISWGITKGDAVFVPDFTFFSSGEVVSRVGATPIFVDVERDTYNISYKKLEEMIKKVILQGKLRPKVIIAVDLFGLPANYVKINEIAQKYDLLVLEDGAQGFGGSINGKKACSFGDISTTSFFPAKPLGCYGDGGAIFTDNDENAELIRSLCIHGKGKNKYDNIRIGMNSRLDTIQAAVLREKLKIFKDYELENINKVFSLYNKQLQGLVEIPVIPEGYYSSFAQYTIKLKNNEERKLIQEKLKSKNIPSMIYYIKPLHKQGAFSDFKYDENDFNVTNELCAVVLSLPMHPYLNKSDIEKITSIMEASFESITY